MSAFEKLKALEERRWDSALPHHSAKREVSKAVLAALPQIMQVVEAAEAALPNSGSRSPTRATDLRAALDALEEALS